MAYYWVSTERQGERGLGLEAQRSAIARFIHGASLLSELQEIESGKQHTNRPQLATCRRHKATLVIARLDRLACNVYFISGLMESGVDFVAVDMPQANRLTIHILAAIAEHQQEAYRTNDDSKEKDALGRLWADRSGGRAVFVMVDRHRHGLSMQEQLLRAIREPARGLR